jgi:hypothetical protein
MAISVNSRDTADNVNSEMTSLAQHKLPASTLSNWQNMLSVACKNAGCNDITLANKLMLHIQELQNVLF